MFADLLTEDNNHIEVLEFERPSTEQVLVAKFPTPRHAMMTTRTREERQLLLLALITYKEPIHMHTNSHKQIVCLLLWLRGKIGVNSSRHTAVKASENNTNNDKIFESKKEMIFRWSQCALLEMTRSCYAAVIVYVQGCACACYQQCVMQKLSAQISLGLQLAHSHPPPALHVLLCAMFIVSLVIKIQCFAGKFESDQCLWWMDRFTCICLCMILYVYTSILATA